MADLEKQNEFLLKILDVRSRESEELIEKLKKELEQERRMSRRAFSQPIREILRSRLEAKLEELGIIREHR